MMITLHTMQNHLDKAGVYQGEYCSKHYLYLGTMGLPVFFVFAVFSDQGGCCPTLHLSQGARGVSVPCLFLSIPSRLRDGLFFIKKNGRVRFCSKFKPQTTILSTLWKNKSLLETRKLCPTPPQSNDFFSVINRLFTNAMHLTKLFKVSILKYQVAV